MRPVSLFVLGAWLLLPGAGEHRRPFPQADDAWTGTITVEEKSTGSVRAGDATVKSETAWRVTYDLKGDGVASWSATVDRRLHFGAFYTVPSHGSGSGFARFSVDGADGVWRADASVQTGLGRMPVTSDLTDQNRYLAAHGPAVIIKEYYAAMGVTLPVAQRETADEETEVPGAEAEWTAPDDAAAHAGSRTKTTHAPLPGLMEVTTVTTTTWNLRRRRAPAAGVRIYGMPCACIEPGETEQSMRFIAGGAPAGGTFSTFVVKSDGKPPEVVSNTGDAEPALEITGTRDTGTVTLSVTYTSEDGRSVTSAPFTVEFCAVEDIQLADGQRDLSFDMADRLTVEGRARAWRGGKDVSTSLAWQIDGMGTSALTATPASKKGDRIEFVYRDLPEQYSDLGEKRLTARLEGDCACARSETIRTFFPLGDEVDAEQAFYYWSQTPAVPPGARPLLRYVRRLPPINSGDPVGARWDFATERVLLSARVFVKDGCIGQVDRNGVPTGRRSEGIDCFAETVRHELQHRADAIEWWGSPRGSLGVAAAAAISDDIDFDHVPNRIEAQEPGCSRFSKHSCDARPFEKVTDLEINAYWKGWTWPIGSLDHEDWSCGPVSKQWKGKRCGQ